MKTTIKIHEVRTKNDDGDNFETQKGKQFWKVNTSEGLISIFDKKIIDFLAARVGGSATVDLAESDDGKYKNIRKTFGDIEAVGLETSKENMHGPPPEPEKDKFTQAREAKNTSCYVSYAKDIFCEIGKTTTDHKGCMNTSIELVKQAIKEFS